MTAPVESLLRRFRDFGERPSVERYLALFHPEATLLDAGMARAITVAEIPEHMEGILKVVPDFRLVPERWREREGTLFIEARNQATRIDALSYRNRVMDLQLVAGSVDELDAFARNLEQTKRFTPKIESANQSEAGVEGRLQISVRP